MSPHPTAAAPGFYRASGFVRWPNAPIDGPWLNGRYRGIAVVRNVKLNGGKGSN